MITKKLFTTALFIMLLGCEGEMVQTIDESEKAGYKTCGNGFLNLGEDCDDGNRTDGDGCTADCRYEISICNSKDSSCTTSICGDGIVAGKEECDDGNQTNGDGCSKGCVVEDKYTCNNPSKKTPEYYLVMHHRRLRIIGPNANSVGCLTKENKSFADKTLSNDGIPQPAGGSNCSPTELDNLKKIFTTTDPSFYPTTSIYTASHDIQTRDDNKFWNPYENYSDNLGTQFDWLIKRPFSTTITANVRYEGFSDEILKFGSTDFLWVYINETLALEILPNKKKKELKTQTVTLKNAEKDNATTKWIEPKYHLERGQIYEIKIFQLSKAFSGTDSLLPVIDLGHNFVGPSICHRCGDGIAVVAPGLEACDDGNNKAKDGCDANCRIEEHRKCFQTVSGKSICP